MFSKVLKAASNLLDSGVDAITCLMSGDQFKRIVYAGYLIGSADGDFDRDEKAALVQYIQKEYPSFELKQIVSIIEECDSKMQFDAKLGTQELINSFADVDAEDGAEVMRFVCFIGRADGKFDTNEKMMARSIGAKLNISLSEYEL